MMNFTRALLIEMKGIAYRSKDNFRNGRHFTLGNYNRNCLQLWLYLKRSTRPSGSGVVTQIGAMEHEYMFQDHSDCAARKYPKARFNVQYVFFPGKLWLTSYGSVQLQAKNSSLMYQQYACLIYLNTDIIPQRTDLSWQRKWLWVDSKSGLEVTKR